MIFQAGRTGCQAPGLVSSIRYQQDERAAKTKQSQEERMLFEVPHMTVENYTLTNRNMVQNGFIWLILWGHDLSWRQVRNSRQEPESGRTEGCCLLAQSLPHAQLAFLYSKGHLPKYGSLYGSLSTPFPVKTILHRNGPWPIRSGQFSKWNFLFPGNWF